MCAGFVPPNIGEIQILRNQESFVFLCGLPNGFVGEPSQPLRGNCINVVPEALENRNQNYREILIQLDLHAK